GDWPSVAQVHEYNRRIRQTIDDGLEKIDLSNGSQYGGFSPELLLNVAIEHRLMHAETLCYMLHQLPPADKIPPLRSKITLLAIPTKQMIDIPGGTATLGLPRDGRFGWDNEFNAHQVSVPAFAIDKWKVTNGDYLEFIGDGGYENP